MASLSPRSVAVTDQILAVLREAAEPLATLEIERRAGYRPYGSPAYQMLRRLERMGQVERLKVPDMQSRYWRLAGGPGFVPPPARAHALRAGPPWRTTPDVTLCGYGTAGRRVVPLAEFDAMLAEPPPWTAVCPLCVSCRGGEMASWARDPVAVIHADAHAQPDSGARGALAAEFRALACLAAEYPERFRDLLEAEQVLQALGG